MGSRGSGRISDYPGSSSSSKGGRGRGNPDSGGAGGPGATKTSGGGKPSGADDRCAKAFAVKLEDVEHSDYFRAHGGSPVSGTTMTLVHRKRLVATTAEGESTGNLPTSFNYLAACMKDGWNYVGTVSNVTGSRTGVSIVVDFAPSRS
jgi:hypothetical protein